MKQSKSIQISLTQPCHEDWEKMTPQEQGRFCDSCQKCVVDFTGFSDEELYRYIATHKGKNLCGRFNNTQLGRQVFKPQKRRKYFQWVMSLGFVVFLTNLFGIDAKAQEPVKKEWQQKPDKKNDNRKDSVCIQKTLTKEEIEAMPTRSTVNVVSTSVGGFSAHNEGAVEISGARDSGTFYIIDGVQLYINKDMIGPAEDTLKAQDEMIPKKIR